MTWCFGVRIALAFILIALVYAKPKIQQDYLHQAPDAHKSYPGWQEPGFSRPSWVLDRTFTDADGKVIKEDRVFLKLKPDRTASFTRQSNRPIFDWKGRARSQRSDTKKQKIFESKETESEESKQRSKDLEALSRKHIGADGTWWFQDEFPLPIGRFKMDTKEGDGSELYRYETKVNFGKVDGYVIKFQTGRILKFKGLQKGTTIPIGGYEVGTFTLKANVNRPIVGKDFQGIQY